jgi:hypothetical protein
MTNKQATDRLIATRLVQSTLSIRAIAIEAGVTHQRVSRLQRELLRSIWSHTRAQGAKLDDFVNQS